MWEPTAPTRREEKVLHVVGKAFNGVIGLVALPTWLFGQKLSGPLRRILARQGAEQHRRLPVPRPGTPPGRPSVEAVMRDLRAVPQELHRSQLKERRKGLNDISTFVLSHQAEVTGLGYSYPSQFSGHVFQGADGERFAP